MLYRYNLHLDADKRPALVKDATYPISVSPLTSTKKVVHLLNALFSMNEKAEEHLYLIAFDTRMNVLGFFLLSQGSASETFGNIRGAFIRALLSGAVSIILAHNHPSGDPSPSEEDMKLYKKFQKASSLLEVQLQDFLILGRSSYYSVKEEASRKEAT